MRQDYTALDTVVIAPYKRQQEIEVPKEVIDDYELPILDQQLRRLSKRFALQVETDCLNTIIAASNVSLVDGVTTFAAGGKTHAASGTEITVANTIGMKDINKARRILYKKNQIMTDLLVDPIAEEGLRNLPNWTLKDNPVKEWTDEPVQYVGNIRIRVSNIVPAGCAFAISNGRSLQGEYNPLGFFVTKQPIYSDMDISKRRDVIYPFMRARYAPVVTNGNCIVSITGLATA